jgi:hypothetical protein
MSTQIIRLFPNSQNIASAIVAGADTINVLADASVPFPVLIPQANAVRIMTLNIKNIGAEDILLGFSVGSPLRLTATTKTDTYGYTVENSETCSIVNDTISNLWYLLNE